MSGGKKDRNHRKAQKKTCPHQNNKRGGDQKSFPLGRMVGARGSSTGLPKMCPPKGSHRNPNLRNTYASGIPPPGPTTHCPPIPPIGAFCATTPGNQKPGAAPGPRKPRGRLAHRPKAKTLPKQQFRGKAQATRTQGRRRESPESSTNRPTTRPICGRHYQPFPACARATGEWTRSQTLESPQTRGRVHQKVRAQKGQHGKPGRAGRPTDKKGQGGGAGKTRRKPEQGPVCGQVSETAEGEGTWQVGRFCKRAGMAATKFWGRGIRVWRGTRVDLDQKTHSVPTMGKIKYTRASEKKNRIQPKPSGKNRNS